MGRGACAVPGCRKNQEWKAELAGSVTIHERMNRWSKARNRAKDSGSGMCAGRMPRALRGKPIIFDTLYAGDDSRV